MCYVRLCVCFRCPADYSPAPVRGRMQCVCEARHQATTRRCHRLKRGLLLFSAHDRLYA